MKIKVLPNGPVNTNTLLIWDGTVAAVVDPALGSSEEVIALVEKENLQLTKLLLTHSHWDHIADMKKLTERYNLEIYVHEADAPNVENPGADGLNTPFAIQGVKPTHFVKEDDVITINNTKLRVIETPGHTPGGICFYLEKENILLSGDTLFQQSYGRLDLPTARPSAMIRSLEKLSKLPTNTVVYPGHGPNTTIGEEKWIQNPRKALNL